MISDEDLAQELVTRLNELLKDPTIKDKVAELIERRVESCSALDNHPSIQVHSAGFGWLGLLNGIVGILPNGSGRIRAYYSDDAGTHLECFQVRT